MCELNSPLTDIFIPGMLQLKFLTRIDTRGFRAGINRPLNGRPFGTLPRDGFPSFVRSDTP